MADQLFLFSRMPDPSSLRLVRDCPGATVVLVGPAVLSDSSHFEGRTVFILTEELPLWDDHLIADGYTEISAEQLIPMLLSHKVFSL